MSSADLLHAAFASTLESALNTALRSDDLSPERLKLLDGKRLRVRAPAGIPLPPLTLTATDGFLHLSGNDIDPVDGTFSATPVDLIPLLRGARRPSDYEGDEDTLLDYQSLFRNIEPDLRDLMAPILARMSRSDDQTARANATFIDGLLRAGTGVVGQVATEAGKAAERLFSQLLMQQTPGNRNEPHE